MREISFRGFHPDKDGDTAIFIGGKKTKGGWYYGKLLEDHVSDIYAIIPRLPMSMLTISAVQITGSIAPMLKH